MTDAAYTEANPWRVAIFGSGPSGFYAAEELLKQEQPKVAVDLFDRLPTPYGLVRGGVAPDHQKIKTVIKLYERTAGRPRFRFFGNVTYGRHLTLHDVLAHYHQALFATGSETDRRLGIPGEDLPGSHPATKFVGWYNAHPDYRELAFELGATQVAVIGVGNVAIDVTRILAAPVAELARTDIADYALGPLTESKVREIHLLGRRGPAQAAFTNPEIREISSIHGVDLVVRQDEMTLDPLSQEYLAQLKDPTNRRNVEILTAQLAKGEGSQPRKIRLRFLVSPVAILGDGRVEALRVERNRLVKNAAGALSAQPTGEFEEIPVQLVFRSIGYMGQPLADLPFDARAGVVPNQGGRVTDPATKAPLPRCYVAGWIKRGPTGVIGTNKEDSISTVRNMLADVGGFRPPEGFAPEAEAIPAQLRQRAVRAVSFADWKRLDALETERGKREGRPRVKFTSVEEMLEALG